MFFITISQQTGSLGDEIANKLAGILGMELITHNYIMENWLSQVAGEQELHMLQESSKFYLHKMSSDEDMTFAEFIEKKLKQKIQKESVIILGLGAQVIFHHDPSAIHIRIVASEEVRKKRLIEKYGMDASVAERTLQLSDRKKRRYLWRIYQQDWEDPSLYHLCINTDGIGIEETAKLLIHLMDLRKKSPLALGSEPLIERAGKKNHDFVNESEREFAKILEMHQIDYQYEPTEFPLEWDAEGNITLSFRPDFYLPEFNTYIELTTMKQKYVTEKNKKIRLLKENYPDIKIKIVYKKDYHNLLNRFKI